MPLFYWGLQNLFSFEKVRLTDILKPCFIGLCLAIPMQLLYWAFDIYFSLSWSGNGIYFYSFFNKEGFFYFPLMAYLLFHYRKSSVDSHYIREILGYFAGYYFLFAFIDVVTGYAVTSYDLIYLPLQRLSLMLSVSILLNRYLGLKDRVKYNYLAGMAALPFLYNIIPVLFLLNRLILAHTVFIPLILVSLIYFYLEIQKSQS